ncbi:MAG: MFS transporter, partial [Chloroflexaceae bacterium]|nr:MFS transporter [Chloroflexaceae bacterium]
MFRLRPPAYLYLFHAALLVLGLAIYELLLNLAILALGFERELLGVLATLPVLSAALLSLPMWAVVTRVGLRTSLILGALLQAAAVLVVAVWPGRWPLLVGTALLGPGSVLFAVASAPLMMRYSDERDRARLFSLNAAILVGVGGLGSLLGGWLPGLAAQLWRLAPQSAPAYQATLALAGGLMLLALLPLLALPGGQEPRTENPEPVGANPVFAQTPHPEPVGSDSIWHFMLNPSPFVLKALVSPLAISCGAALLFPFLNLYFQQRFAVADATLGLIFAAMGIATGLATLAAPWLSARLGPMGSVVLTQALAIPCLLLLGLAPLLSLAVGVAVLRAALMNMAAPLYTAYVLERTAVVHRPLMNGLLQAAMTA